MSENSMSSATRLTSEHDRRSAQISYYVVLSLGVYLACLAETKFPDLISRPIVRWTPTHSLEDLASLIRCVSGLRPMLLSPALYFVD